MTAPRIPVEIRSSRVYYLLLTLVFLVSLSLLAQAWVTWQTGHVTTNTNHVVHRIDDQTSPEALKRQRDAIDGIVLRLDCNNRSALQDTIDVLVERGVLKSGSLNVITDNCKGN